MKKLSDEVLHYEIEEDYDENGKIYHRALRFCKCKLNRDHGKRSKIIKRRVVIEKF